MMNRIMRLLVGVLLVAGMLFWNNHQLEKRINAECALQHSNQQIYVMESQKKEAKNVEIKKSAIYSKPNASRDSLLNKMRTGQL